MDEEEDNWMQWQTGTLSGKNRSRLDGREETDGKENFVGKNGEKLLNIVNCLVDYDFFVVNLKFI